MKQTLRPQKEHYAPFYANYINLVPEGDLFSLLETEHQKTQALLNSLDEIAGDFRYAEGKWSVKELLLHMLDTEQIMSYRALRIARGDKTEMPGFDQDEYAARVNASPLSLVDLVLDWKLLRTHTIRLLSRFDAGLWEATGTASSAPFSVRSLAFIILGHELHHRRILEERYISAL